MSSKYHAGDRVDLVILRETNLGFVAKINGQEEGLLYYDQLFKHLQIEQKTVGYIRKVRPDGGIDLLLQSFGHLGAEELGKHILEALRQRKGFIPVNARSPAEDIYDLFGVSRKKFKMALGSLYKKRLVEFTEEGTELISSED
jgi:predicted RNA-binding protein (virulence factor B family)